EDTISVRMPVDDAVGLSVIRQPKWHAAEGGDCVYVFIAVVVSGKGDCFSVWGEFRKRFDTRRRAEAMRESPIFRYDPKVIAIGEDDMRLGDIRESQQSRMDLRGSRVKAQQRQV